MQLDKLIRNLYSNYQQVYSLLKYNFTSYFTSSLNEYSSYNMRIYNINYYINLNRTSLIMQVINELHIAKKCKSLHIF